MANKIIQTIAVGAAVLGATAAVPSAANADWNPKIKYKVSVSTCDKEGASLDGGKVSIKFNGAFNDNDGWKELSKDGDQFEQGRTDNFYITDDMVPFMQNIEVRLLSDDGKKHGWCLKQVVIRSDEGPGGTFINTKGDRFLKVGKGEKEIVKIKRTF